MSERVLITGGSGFIGTNLVDHYTRRGTEVLNLDPESPRNPAQRDRWRRIDPLDREQVSEAVRSFDPTHVFHMGARTDLRGTTVGDYALNTTAQEHLIEVMRGLTQLRRAIFASTRLVCRIGYQPTAEDDYCPTTPYGESKIVGERMVRASGLDVPWVIVRPTSIWGPWFDVPYKTFFSTIAAGRYVHVRGRDVRKSFGYVGNTVHELDRLMFAPEADRLNGRTIYLADYPPVRVRELADEIQRAMGVRRIRTVPVQVLLPAAVAGDLLQRLGMSNPPLTRFRLANLLTEMVHDLSPLEGVVGPLPHDVPSAVRTTVDWMRDQGDLPT